MGSKREVIEECLEVKAKAMGVRMHKRFEIVLNITIIIAYRQIEQYTLKYESAYFIPLQHFMTRMVATLHAI